MMSQTNGVSTAVINNNNNKINININDNNDNIPGGIYSGLGQRDPERPVICAFNFPGIYFSLFFYFSFFSFSYSFFIFYSFTSYFFFILFHSNFARLLGDGGSS